MHAIFPLKEHLVNAYWWTSSASESYTSKREGYPKEDKDKWRGANFLNFINPFTLIQPLDYSAIKNTSLLLPELIEHKPEIIALIAGYILWCKNFNNCLLQIQQFVFSRETDKNISLANKLVVNITVQTTTEELMARLTPEEKNFVEFLFTMYENLFFGIVGCDRQGEDQHLYFYYERLRKSVEDYEKTIKS